MSNVFRNMSRTVCTRARTAGDINGPIAITVRADPGQAAALAAAWDQLAALPDRLRAELWLSAEKAGDAPSVEESIRGKDAKIGACFIANFSDVEHASAATAAIRRLLGPEPVIGCYRLTSALDHQDIAS